jgi:hypothetical protein
VAKIYRPDSGQLSIAEAKRLILEAAPRELFVNVYSHADGTLKAVMDEEPRSIYAGFLDADFSANCEKLGITPRWKYRPGLTGYTGDSGTDDLYVISHDELLRMAALYGLGLEVSEAPAVMPVPTAQAEPVAAVGASIEPVRKQEPPAPPPLTTGDIASAFDGLKWTEDQWKKPLGDKPNWLVACVSIPGRRGSIETRWNPVLIGGALVSQGHVQARNVRAKFQTSHLLQPWLDAWKTYEADFIDTP